MPALGTEQLFFAVRVIPHGEGEQGDVGFFTAGPAAYATVGKTTSLGLLIWGLLILDLWILRLLILRLLILRSA